MRHLDFPESSLAWILAFYSIVHVAPSGLPPIMREMRRVLSVGGLALVSFHVGNDIIHLDEQFGAPVNLAELWKTDFVIRRLDDQYICVEVEKPQDPVFTKYPQPSAELSHAIGQVLSWFAWVEDNIAYAQSDGFPRIHCPRGVIVIGRRSQMDAAQRRMFEASERPVGSSPRDTDIRRPASER